MEQIARQPRHSLTVTAANEVEALWLRPTGCYRDCYRVSEMGIKDNINRELFNDCYILPVQLGPTHRLVHIKRLSGRQNDQLAVTDRKRYGDQ